jgi:uncharacterized membrane protein YphA (DoxX/SURF4 family)
MSILLVPEPERISMNLALWVIQSILAVAFIAIGSMKLFAYEKYKAVTEKNGPSGISRGLATFIGIAELAGGVGIVLPMATNSAPLLSLCAAVGLSVIMLLAIGFHLRHHESPVPPAVLFLLAVLVVYGRSNLLK